MHFFPKQAIVRQGCLLSSDKSSSSLRAQSLQNLFQDFVPCSFYMEQASLFIVRGFSSWLSSPALPQAPAAYLEIITNNHILTLFSAGLTQESRKLQLQ